MTRRRLSLALLALVFCAGAAYAVSWAVGELRYRALLADRALIAGDRDVTVKAEVTCPAPKNTQVFVIFGQSNAANHGSHRSKAPDGVVDFYEGRCFTGDDPQFSATGNGGSPWPAFATALRQRGETGPILMANVAVGNTGISEWVSGKNHSKTLGRMTENLLNDDYAVTAFLFFQGEADHETSEREYLDHLTMLTEEISSLSPGTPLIASDTSICGARQPKKAQQLSEARIAAARANPAFILGPDTDALGTEFRYDGCHFTASGLSRLGEMWADAVAPYLRRD